MSEYVDMQLSLNDDEIESMIISFLKDRVSPASWSVFMDNKHDIKEAVYQTVVNEAVVTLLSNYSSLGK